MTLYCSIFSEVGEDLTFLKAFFLLLMASLHVSLNQTANKYQPFLTKSERFRKSCIPYWFLNFVNATD